MFVISRPADPLSGMIQEFFRKELSFGSTKKSQEAALNQTYGRREATAECIAVYLSTVRLDTYPHLEPVEAISGWDVLKVMKKYIERYDAASVAPSMTINKAVETPPKPTETKSAVLSDLYDEVVALVRTKDMDEMNDRSRRKKIEEGQTDLMTDEDREYFASKAAEIKSSAGKYEELAKVPYRVKGGITEIDV